MKHFKELNVKSVIVGVIIIIFLALVVKGMMFNSKAEDTKQILLQEVTIDEITINSNKRAEIIIAIGQETIDIRDLRLEKAKINALIDLKKENITILEQADLELKVQNNNLSYNLD